MSYGMNGGVIGPDVVPTTSSAPGIWSLGEIAEAERDGIWPAPFSGWFASWNPGIYNDSGDSCSSGQVALDTSDNLYISCVNHDSSASMYTSAIAKVQSDGTALVNNNRFDILSGGSQEATRLMGLEAAGTNLYISGDQVSSGYAWRAKLDSSYSVQWFGDSGGDQQYVQSGQPTYANSHMKLYVSPDEVAGIHVYYGYYNSYSSYNVIMQPIDPSTGYKWYPDTYAGNAYPVMVYSNPTSFGGYIHGFCMNNERMAYICRAFSNSYGGYNVQFGHADDMIWSGNSGMASARLTPTGTGGSFAGVYANSPKISPYRATGTPGAYYFNGLLDVTGGTYNGDAYISKWDPYTGGYLGWSLGTRYTVNPADSPGTPTTLSTDASAVNDSTDTHCYFLVRDNAQTPAQYYLVKHDIANQSCIWQRKINIHLTSGVGSYDVPFCEKLVIDSTDEHVYGIFSSITMNSVAQPDNIVFKLPTDGGGAGTYTVGNYTVTYGASNMTVTAGDILTLGTGADGATYTSFANSGTLTQSLTQPTATWDRS